jgi:hypothetical protein
VIRIIGFEVMVANKKQQHGATQIRAGSSVMYKNLNSAAAAQTHILFFLRRAARLLIFHYRIQKRIAGRRELRTELYSYPY